MTSRHRSRATLVGVTPEIPREARRGGGAESAQPRRRLGLVAHRYAGGGAAERRAVRGQRRQQPGHRPAPRPLHRPRVAGAQRGREYAALRQRVADLNAEIAVLTDSVNDRRRPALPAPDREARGPRRADPRTGPGITVTLSDAPEEVIAASDQDLNLLVVHQQDIQAVVNAMWQGGATAVTVQGQRVVTTTGIKCEGNAVQLQGVPYSQPYEIAAVGDPGPRWTRSTTTTTSSSTASTAARPTSPSAGSSRSRTRSPRRRTTACSTSTTRSRCAEPPLATRREPAGRTDGPRRRRRGRRLGRATASAWTWVVSVGVGGRRLGSVGSSNEETTIVTVEPSAALAVAPGSGR